MPRRFLLTLAGGLMLFTAVGQADEKPAFETISITGRVVYAADALQRLHGVKSVAEGGETALVLETPKGQLHPLVDDKRGNAFRLDERLMGKPMELLVRRYEGSPFVQVIRVHEIVDGEKLLVDYWCDICAISIFELKPCDCCQGPIRLRKRKLNAQGEPVEEQ